jgi:hypothetical protein
MRQTKLISCNDSLTPLSINGEMIFVMIEEVFVFAQWNLVSYISRINPEEHSAARKEIP